MRKLFRKELLETIISRELMGSLNISTRFSKDMFPLIDSIIRNYNNAVEIKKLHLQINRKNRLLIFQKIIRLSKSNTSVEGAVCKITKEVPRENKKQLRFIDEKESEAIEAILMLSTTNTNDEDYKEVQMSEQIQGESQIHTGIQAIDNMDDLDINFLDKIIHHSSILETDVDNMVKKYEVYKGKECVENADFLKIINDFQRRQSNMEKALKDLNISFQQKQTFLEKMVEEHKLGKSYCDDLKNFFTNMFLNLKKDTSPNHEEEHSLFLEGNKSFSGRVYLDQENEIPNKMKDTHINHDIQIEKVVSSNNENNLQSTLGPFDVSEANNNLSAFVQYRKKPNKHETRLREVEMTEKKQDICKRKYRRNIVDATIKIDTKLATEATDKKTLKKNIEFMLREEYKKVNNVCIICFKSLSICANEDMLVYAYCKFTNCTTYIFCIEKSGNVTVYRDTEIVHDKDVYIAGQLRGIARSLVKQDLQKKSAYSYRNTQISNAADDIAEVGNLQNIRSLETYRKCKSEANFDSYYDKVTYIDVVKMQLGPYKNYIQQAKSPLGICLWEHATFKTLSANKAILRDCNHTIHIDATGGCIEDKIFAEKRILIYNIVLHLPKLQKICVIAQAILSRHTIVEISWFLDKLKEFCDDYKYTWSFSKRVVTDVSFALIGAINKSFNKIWTCLEYIEKCFNFLKSCERAPSFVIIQFCKCHYIKIICQDLDKQVGSNSKLKYVIKNALMAAFDLKTLNECEEWFKHLFTVLLMPFKNEAYRRSLKVLKMSAIEVDEEVIGRVFTLWNNEDEEHSKSISSSSSFMKMFQAIKNDIAYDIENIRSGKEINDLRNDSVCDFIVSKYCAFLPLWTNIMGVYVDPTGKHVSNGPVEVSFLKLKREILGNRTGLRPGEFIKLTRADYLTTLKDIRYSYRMFGDIDRNIENFLLDKPLDNVPDPSEIHTYALPRTSAEPEETWQKKNPRKQKHIKIHHLYKEKRDKNRSGFIKRMKKEDIVNSVIDLTEVEGIYSSSIRETSYIFNFVELFTEVNKVNNLVDLGFYGLLELDDWLSLAPHTKLTNFLLDCALLCILKESGRLFCYSIACQYEGNYFKNLTVLHDLKPEIVFVPILKNEHYTLCVLNFSTCTFLYLDSYHDNTGKAEYQEFVSTLNEEEKKIWCFKFEYQRDIQIDATSCGVFILMYAHHILRDEALQKLPDPQYFRKEVKDMIKRNQDVSSFCFMCSGNIAKVSKNRCAVCSYSICNMCFSRNSNFKECRFCRDKVFFD